MSKCIFRDSTILENYGPPVIVAEVNTSHNGDMNTAKRMIDAALDSGCYAVKFQSWSKESLYSTTYYNENPIAKRMVQKFSFGEDQLLEVAKYCKERGIAFSSTPYSKAEVQFLLEKCDVPYIKVASMDLTNLPFLDFIARTGAPIVLATGMGDMDEVRSAVRTIESAGNRNICILHCISIYPPNISSIRLKNIIGLREEFPDFPIGFSDHSIGYEMATAAVALGAALVEKHLTLDKSKIGMDNQMATEPDEMRKLVSQCKNVQIGLGGKERIVLKEELEQRKKMRRSLVATRDLPVGKKITREDLDAKRPGTGIPANRMQDVIGKTVIDEIKADTLINISDIES